MLRPRRQKNAALTVREVVQQRIFVSQHAAIAVHIEFDIEIRRRIARLPAPENQEMLKRIRAARRHIRVVFQIESGIEHRHRVNLAGDPPLQKMPQTKLFRTQAIGRAILARVEPGGGGTAFELAEGNVMQQRVDLRRGDFRVAA
jgi:hypothetical protein